LASFSPRDGQRTRQHQHRADRSNCQTSWPSARFRGRPATRGWPGVPRWSTRSWCA